MLGTLQCLLAAPRVQRIPGPAWLGLCQALHSLSRTCSLPPQAFAHSLPQNTLPSPPLFGSQPSHHLLKEVFPDLPNQVKSSPITCSHGTMCFPSVAAAGSLACVLLSEYWLTLPWRLPRGAPLAPRATTRSVLLTILYYSLQYLEHRKLSINNY